MCVNCACKNELCTQYFMVVFGLYFDVKKHLFFAKIGMNIKLNHRFWCFITTLWQNLHKLYGIFDFLTPIKRCFRRVFRAILTFAVGAIWRFQPLQVYVVRIQNANLASDNLAYCVWFRHNLSYCACFWHSLRIC